MSIVSGILSSLARKYISDSDIMSSCIFYKIVDSFYEDKTYLLQCINTKATFRSRITEIIFDVDILNGLHPVQACYVGIEYSKEIKGKYSYIELQKKQEAKMKKASICRYGKYKICFQNREGKICFINKKTNENFIMDPRDIALSEELICEFDAAQAFYIGLLAGLKLNNPIKRKVEEKTTKIPYLRIVE